MLGKREKNLSIRRVKEGQEKEELCHTKRRLARSAVRRTKVDKVGTGATLANNTET